MRELMSSYHAGLGNFAAPVIIFGLCITTAMLRSASHTAARSLAQLRPPTASSTLVATRSYHENIVEHYESPRNVGSLPKDDEDVGTGESGVADR